MRNLMVALTISISLLSQFAVASPCEHLDFEGSWINSYGQTLLITQDGCRSAVVVDTINNITYNIAFGSRQLTEIPVSAFRRDPQRQQSVATEQNVVTGARYSSTLHLQSELQYVQGTIQFDGHLPRLSGNSRVSVKVNTGVSIGTGTADILMAGLHQSNPDQWNISRMYRNHQLVTDSNGQVPVINIFGDHIRFQQFASFGRGSSVVGALNIIMGLLETSVLSYRDHFYKVL